MKVGLKFCGNCNPSIDIPALTGTLAEQAAWLSFVPWDGEGYAVLLVLNACDSGCAGRPDFSGPVITVAGESVDQWPVSPGALPEAILNAIKAAAPATKQEWENRTDE